MGNYIDETFAAMIEVEKKENLTVADMKYWLGVY